MAVRLKRKNEYSENKSHSNENSENKSHSWVTAGLIIGAGLTFGYGLVPAYAGMLFASQVPTIAFPLIGSTLTEAARIQAMTKGYNLAMTAAPVVSAVSSKALSATVDAISGYMHPEAANKAIENMSLVSAAA